MTQQPVYREFAPRARLERVVHCVWSFTAPGDDAPQPIAPDGRPELIVHLNAPYAEMGEAVAQPAVLFAGQLTKPLTLIAHGESAVLGVRFRPEAARAFLGLSAAIATDKRLDLFALHGAPAHALHRACRDLGSAVDAAQDYVEARVRDAAIDAEVAEAVAAIMANAPPPQSALSERQLERRFKTEVGVSPRMLQSIVRFRRVFDAIEHPQTPDWVRAALDAGYFDQPQMARDFRRFLGCTARAWARQRAGLAHSLAMSETYKKTAHAGG